MPIPGSKVEALLGPVGLVTPALLVAADRKPFARPFLTCVHITPAYASTCLAKRQSATREIASSVPAHDEFETPSTAHCASVAALVAYVFCHSWYQAPAISRLGVIEYLTPTQNVCSILSLGKLVLLGAVIIYPPESNAPGSSG